MMQSRNADAHAAPLAASPALEDLLQRLCAAERHGLWSDDIALAAARVAREIGWQPQTEAHGNG